MPVRKLLVTLRECETMMHLTVFFLFLSIVPRKRFMIDKEGEMLTNEVSARFVNGKPQSIESTYVMQSPEAWDRYIIFMERYAETNDLRFNLAN